MPNSRSRLCRKESGILTLTVDNNSHPQDEHGHRETTSSPSMCSPTEQWLKARERFAWADCTSQLGMLRIDTPGSCSRPGFSLPTPSSICTEALRWKVGEAGTKKSRLNTTLGESPWGGLPHGVSEPPRP